MEAEVLDVDVASSTLTYTTGSGATKEEHFDLILGADGARSKVRAAMQRHDKAMEVVHIPAQRFYGCFYGLKAEGGAVLGQGRRSFMIALPAASFQHACQALHSALVEKPKRPAFCCSAI